MRRVVVKRGRGSLVLLLSGSDTSITLWRRGAVAIRIGGHECGMYFGGWFQAQSVVSPQPQPTEVNCTVTLDSKTLAKELYRHQLRCVRR